MSPKQARFLRDLSRRIAERLRQKETRDALQVALDNGQVRMGAESFCVSIISAFDQRKSWTAVQMEHAEKILMGNTDPDDGED